MTTNYQKHVSKNPIQKFLINNFNHELLRLVQSTNAQTILDAGCGEGFTLELIRSRGLGKKLMGVDYFQEAIDLGRKTNPKVELKQGSVYELPFPDKSFDLVLCNEVLEHLENPPKALAELKRVTKKYCLISIPDEPLFMLSNLLRGKYLSSFGNHPEHINHWNAKSLTPLLHKSQLYDVRTQSVFPWVLILATKKDI